jgi:signal transduction histidine kinase
LDAKANEFIAYCVEGTQRMDRLIKDLLAYARAANTTTAVPRATVNLKTVVEAVLTNLEGARREGECRIAMGELPNVFVEETLIQQVLQNLIGNAIKYRRPSVPVEIKITAEHRGGEWVISVADNGIGIQPESLETVFGLFQRLDRDASSGTGLGLAICRRIVERHGGKIWAESQPGTGSIFQFSLPDVTDEAVSDESRSEPVRIA